MKPDSFERRALAAILVAGLGLRVILAWVVCPGQGFASDLSLFNVWATTLATVGPGSFYATVGGTIPA